MRDVAVTLLIFGALPLILWRPYIGVLVWSWLSYMNPHRQTWGFAYDMPFAQIVFATLVLSLIFYRERWRLPWSGMLLLWVVFIVWMTLTTQFAIYPERATNGYNVMIKIQLATWLTMLLINDRERITYLIWVIVGSIGYYSVKGGVFTLLSGGAHRVYGPAQSFLEENNALALATLMTVPLMVYLYRVNAGKRWLRLALGFSVASSVVSALGSQSRGALLAVLAVAGFYWLKTNSKLISGTAMALVAVLLFNFMPASWHERMDTIRNYEEDPSAMARIYAWKYSINIANDRLLGGGFNHWSMENYGRYAPEAREAFVAHSIYFSVLADHGWIGLALYLGVIFLAWRRLSRLSRMGDPPGDPFMPGTLARMLQVSLVAYLSGGAFLSLSYFDFAWHLIALAALLASLYELNGPDKAAPESVLVRHPVNDHSRPRIVS